MAKTKAAARKPAASNSKPASKPADKSVADKTPHERSAPIDRAVKFVRLADKNVRRAIRLIDNWHGEATAEQKKINGETLHVLKSAAPLVERALVGVGLLQSGGFAPVEARGRAVIVPPEPGDLVKIKDKHYMEALHGAINEFSVVTTVRVPRPAQGAAPASTVIHVRIRPSTDPRGPQTVLPWSQLEPLAAIEDDGGEENEGAGEGDETNLDNE